MNVAYSNTTVVGLPPRPSRVQASATVTWVPAQQATKGNGSAAGLSHQLDDLAGVGLLLR